MALIESASRQMEIGIDVDVAELTREDPEYASAVQEMLPTIAALVGLGNRPAPAKPPERLGRYKLLSKLGSGGMGRVFLAQHTELHKTFALKLLPSERMLDPQCVARFEREMKAIGRFDHKHIVRATDAGCEDGHHFLVMEYIDGLDLGNLARRLGPLRVADACAICRQAMTGMAYIHAHGFVHRDLKPSNLMLTREGTVKILDLGLARLIGPPAIEHTDLTGIGQMIGTVDYMAPEQADDSRDVDGRADIYSLGATLYYLLVGHAPFALENQASTIKKLTAISTMQPQPVNEIRPEVPSQLAVLITRMLAKSPDDRPSTVAEVARALEPFCEGSNLEKTFKKAIAIKNSYSANGAVSTSGLNAAQTVGAVARRSERRSPDGTLLAPRPGDETPSNIVRRRVLLAAAAVPLVLAAIFLVVRDNDGNEKGRLAVDDSDRVEIVQTAANDAQPQSPNSAGESKAVREPTADKPATEPGANSGTASSSIPGARSAHVALKFDGKNDWVEIPKLTYDGSTPLTVELKATPASEHAYRQLVLISNFDYADGQSYGISLFQRGDVYPRPAYVSWAMACSGQNKESQSLIALADAWKIGRPTHIAYIADGHKFRFYLDGKLWRRGELGEEPAQSKRPFTIGGHPILKGYFQGTIDEVRISSAARYNENFAPNDYLEPDTDTLALFHCDEGKGTTLADSSAKHNDGNIHGATWEGE
jgi:serine/threonine protein kinase